MYLSPFCLLLLSQITGAVSTSIQYYPRYAPGEAYLAPRNVDDELWGREAEAIADPDADSNASFYTEDVDDIGLRARNIADLYERELDQLYARMEPFMYDQFLKSPKNPTNSPKSGGSGTGKGGSRSGNGKGEGKGKSKGSTRAKDAEGMGSGSKVYADDADGSDTESSVGTSTPSGSRSRAQSQSGSYKGQGSSYGGQTGSYQGQGRQRESSKSRGSTSPNKKPKGQYTQQDADSYIEMTDRTNQ